MSVPKETPSFKCTQFFDVQICFLDNRKTVLVIADTEKMPAFYRERVFF